MDEYRAAAGGIEGVLNVRWPFDISPATMVVTTTYVIRGGQGVLCVTHEFDREEGIIRREERAPSRSAKQGRLDELQRGQVRAQTSSRVQVDR
jgi:hypothetical protein